MSILFWAKLSNSIITFTFIDDKIHNYAVQILNDIFNYYLYGNKEIPIDM